MENKHLIELITREVIDALKKRANNSNEVNANKNIIDNKSNIQVLFVFTGVANLINNFYTELEKINIQYDILLSQGAQAVFNINELTTKLKAKNIFKSFTYDDKNKFLNKYDIVIVPFLSLSALTHISSLNTDSLVCNYLIWHLINKKPIIISTEPLLTQIGNTKHEILCEINRKIAKLCEYGVEIVPINGITNTLNKYLQNKEIKTENLNNMSSTLSSDNKCNASIQNCLSCGLCVLNRKDDINLIKDSGALRVTLSSNIDNKKVNFDEEIAKMIDHTLLKPDAKQSDIDKLCEEAMQYKFASVCVNPSWVKYCAQKLKGSNVKVCTVVGFPLGATSTNAKVCETIQAINDGADEIDMVINIGALKSGHLQFVENDIREVVKAASGKVVKVILETSLLTDDEKVIACKLAKNAGAHFVKTSTGFGGGGATVKDIILMRQTVGPDMGVKASGGVRDLKTAKELVSAGATRIGASASVAIVSGQVSNKNY